MLVLLYVQVTSVLESFGDGYHFPLFNAAEGKKTESRPLIIRKLLDVRLAKLRRHLMPSLLMFRLHSAHDVGQGISQSDYERRLFLTLEGCQRGISKCCQSALPQYVVTA